MPEITDLLESTTPSDLPPLDIAGLATGGRRRRQRRRAVLAAPVVAALVAVAAVAVQAPDDKGSTVAGPSGIDLTAPVGSWTQGATSPLEPRVSSSFGGTLSDGRVVVWGGVPKQNGGGLSTLRYADGAIYDPDADEWEAIPAAPIPELAEGNTWFIDTQISQDRLAVTTADLASTKVSAAVYDFTTREWTAAPAQTAIPSLFDAVVWDGTTLAVVRVDDGFRLDTPADRVEAPVTLRWELGADRWTTGAPAPLPMRHQVGKAIDGGRLALWGGIGGTNNDVFADGALYDLASDTWTPIAPSPLSGRLQHAIEWVDGRLLVGGGYDGLAETSGPAPGAAWYDPDTGTWTPGPSLPFRSMEASGDYVLSRVEDGATGRESTMFLGPDGWEPAPNRDLHRLGDVTIATSLPLGNPGNGPFEVLVRAGRDEWVRAADAPFGNRLDPLIVATGTRLVVIGGLEGKDLTLTDDTWVFDVTG